MFNWKREEEIKWGWGLSEESISDFGYASKEEAIRAGKDDYPNETLYVVETHRINYYLDAQDFLEQFSEVVTENLGEFCGEQISDVLADKDKVAELQALLDPFAKWCKDNFKHYEIDDCVEEVENKGEKNEHDKRRMDTGNHIQ